MTEDEAKELVGKVNAEISKIASNRRGRVIPYEEIIGNAIFWNKLVEDHAPESVPFIAVCMANMKLGAIDISKPAEGETVH